ncbi:NAD(P)-dependent oxidoreductase [Marinobacterium lutimaris]|uniref:3-hydroxyisobutyrate dehydrogenase n=1 Tax=Marinobacterium lutimaris TaxID=568106 RepID=A0A1H6DUJ2_9GAMM|nr:NAD(P)-dependent oxidoreductase [Marinobacterium lutimaris]SEG89052.1 3-hydroxyisobutyrate dehydrogenase [Marinobacterium lutimaris]
MQTIAFAGLGAMGLPMAKNLLKAGFNVRGIDLNPTALDSLKQAGGQLASSVQEAAAGADMLILMVVNAGQAEQVLFDQGALAALNPEGTVCLMATCPQGQVAQIAARVMAQGRQFIDAPVSGGVVGAEAGSLTIMAACPEQTYAEQLAVFQAVGERIFHVGEKPGQGAVVKTVNQLLCGVHIAVVAEAISLAAKVGVDLDILLEIMGGSAASSWMLKNRGPRMLESEPEVTSAVDIFVKDLGIVLETGREVQAALPLAASAHQMFLSTSGRGDGRADDSQVIRSYHLLNGVARD